MIPYFIHRALLARGETTSAAAVRSALDAAEAHAWTNAFIELFGEEAAARARASDARFQSGTARALEGCIVAVKDNISIKGKRLSCASRILGDFTSVYDATVIARLRAAGALLLGRTNMDEFAMGSSGEFSCFGPVLHPLDSGKVAGGSSAGSAVAVATGAAMIALGSDTGGSVRQPAAFCGVVGCKPTYGFLSRYGLVSFAPSCDHIGVMARTVDDISLALSTLGGVDPRDSTSIGNISLTSEGDRSHETMRVGFPREHLGMPMDGAIQEAIASFRESCVHAGCPVSDVSLPHTPYALPAYVILTTAEASSNLARFDGVRFGSGAAMRDDFHDWISRTRTAGFGKEVRRRILLGAFALSHGYAERFYQKAEFARSLVRQDFSTAFETIDILVLPTTLTTAFPLGERAKDPVRMYQSDVCTAPASLAGIPAISVPFGVDARGLPIGIQVMVGAGRDGDMLQFARFVEQEGRKRG
jgi:aspartyl-tRNA(Asn)/glutamyl-tRNA(Gln) amidotransferase subunit A